MILSKPSTRAHKHKHQHEHDHQPSRFKVAVTATRALRGVWPQRASMPGGREYTSLRSRDRNKVKFSKWGFYFKEEVEGHAMRLKRLKAAASIHKARVPGSTNQPLVLEKVSKNKVEVAWPLPVSADTCARFLKVALDDNWRNFVTDPAGVQGAHQEAGTAEEGVVAAEAAGEESLEDAMEAALFAEPPVSRGASGSAAGPFSPRPPAASPSSSGAIASSAATAEARSGVNLLALRLEAITALYGSRERGHYEDLQQAYTVNWTAELGRGTYGKVYVGTKGPATGLHRDECQGGFAIKMLRDKDADVPKGVHADAVWAADLEVKRHVALGLHPNVVGLVDVGLFMQPPHRPRCNSLANRSAHIGLVFDLYEIDVRQFLNESSFTQGGMRHALNSVLEGLRFIHDRGCIHCDLKPANIFMRGAIHLRGCFEKEVLTLQQLGDWDAVAPCLRSRWGSGWSGVTKRGAWGGRGRKGMRLLMA